MSASVIEKAIEQTSLPSRLVPTRIKNQYRLVNLWDIVTKFAVGRFIVLTHCLSSGQAQLDAITKTGGGGSIVSDEQYDAIIENVISALNLCKSSGFPDPAMKISLSLREMQSRRMDVSSLATELRNIQEAIMVDSVKQWFIKVSPELSPLVDNAALFGTDVATAFPSAQKDLTEAGNCLAVECGTACVFHLMRASEVALRVLAADRQVSYPDASLSSKQVGDLLAALDGKLSDLRKANGNLWPSRDVKDEQISFFHKAVAEFRDFNEAWRKYMAHAHEGAFYDADTAKGIMKHVRTMMELLAPKISESHQTPLYWT